MSKQILVLHADIGAAKNITKNICLLDQSVFFPVDLQGMSRLDYLMKYLYPTNYRDWFACEYRLKQYTSHGIHMELGDPRIDGLIPLNKHLTDIIDQQHFILDLMDHNTALDLSHCEYVNLLAIAPNTTFGLNWQIRAYTMKYGADKMFNFTFCDINTIEQFKQIHGQQTWVDVNLCNFYDMVRQRRRILNRSKLHVMPLELIIWPHNWSYLIEYLEKIFGLEIPRDQAYTLLTQWMSLHWPTEKTNDWKYQYIFKEFRPLEITKKLALCEKFEHV
jgi:hypothetical protein